MTAAVNSKNSIPIRLPDERWDHITREHPELIDLHDKVLDTVNNPEKILAGGLGELMAIAEIEAGKWLVVVYRELEADGFIITAFLTRRKRSLDRRTIVWSQ